jgi:glycosyltransferase involved in cell wall biosynthesis
VQRACAVTNGQARRSGAGIPYRGYAEFEAAVDLVLDTPELGATLGGRGRAFVEQRYRWESVLTGYERVLQALAGGADGRARRLGAAR